MKQTITNTANGNETIEMAGGKQATESRLYNLLFAGRITLKEYFEQLKQNESLQKAA